jgi:cytochrome oxidase assembly protein ShyY1
VQVVPATTFCLGVWQYRRRAWKMDKIAELDQKVKQAQPVSLPSE